MKKFLPLLILTFLTCITLGQTLNTYRSFYDYTYDKDVIVKNRISVIAIQTVIIDSTPPKQTYYFDKKGLLTHAIFTKFKGDTTMEYNFITDSSGNLTERQEIDHELHNKTTEMIYRTYSGDKMVKDSSGLFQSSHEFFYNKKGILEKTVFKVMGSTSITVYTYNNKNHIINSKEKRYLNERDTIGNLFSNRDFIYNNKGQLLKEEERINDDSYTSNAGSTTYTYNDKGHVLEIKRQKGISQTIKYNNRGLIISIKESNSILGKELVMEDRYSYVFTK